MPPVPAATATVAPSAVVPIPTYAPSSVQQASAHAPVQTATSNSVAATSASKELSRAEIEEIVREYLATHSDEVAQAAASESLAPTSAAEALEATPGEGKVVGSDLNFKGRWNHGLEFETPNKDFRVHVGGRTQVDAAFFETDTLVESGLGGIGNIPDSVNFRRGRLRVDGTMWEVFEFAAEYDFINQFNADPLVPPAPNTVAPIPAMTDLWLTIKHLPVIGNVRIGNHKDPLSMEHLTSSRFLPFLERSFNFDAFTGAFNNGFSPGISTFHWTEDERMTWAVGVFKNVQNPFGFAVGGGEYNAEGRVTMLPVYEGEGRYLVHIGGAASQRDLDNQQQRFRSRGNVRNGPPGPLNAILADTGIMYGDEQQIVGGEVAAVWGSLTLQAEYIGTWIHDAQWPQAAPVERGTAYFQGTYVQAFWFLTGEHESYNRHTGVFERVVPHENFFLVPGCGRCLCGRGAWQIGARYSFLDLNSMGIQGGMLHSMTWGLNWFLNPNAKLQWNYDYTFRDSASGFSNGDIQAFGTRLAMDF
ncbi:MAG: hypothetical protein KF708_13755 [Pirellulales bacterium]|nr:hypothetical protein [Pirellulales bacterium]